MQTRNFLQWGFRVLLAVVFTAPFFYPGDALSRAIKQVRPHIVLPPPRPPEHLQRKAQFSKWKSEDAITALKTQGLEAVAVESGLTARAYEAQESIIFRLPSFGDDVGGVAANYDSEEKISAAVYYYSSLNTTTESPVWRIFRKDNILLLVSGRVPEEKAREYEKALQQMK